MNKKGMVGALANKTILSIVGILVLLTLFTALIPQIQQAGEDLCNTGVPFGTVFGGNGLVVILLMVSLLVTIVGLAFYHKGKKR